MIDMVFFGLIAVGGVLAGLPKDTRFAFLKAAVLMIALQLASVVMIVLMLLLNGVVYAFHGSGTIDSLFTLLGIVLSLAGIGVYWILVGLSRKFDIEVKILTLVEYLIQWSLIYVTIYQVTIDNVIKGTEFKEILGVTPETINPTYIIMLILPALISTWIAIIVFKLRVKSL